jgi:hypothetical protein
MFASHGLFSDNGCVSVTSRVAEGRSICCVPRSIFRYNNFVPVLSRAPGVNMEPGKFDKVVRSEKRKVILDIKNFKFHFQNIPTENMQR